METVKSRHNIFYTDYEWQLIKDKAKELGKSASELVREFSLKKVLEIEEIELSEYIKQTCGYADKEEELICQELFKGSNYNSSERYEELTLDEILQD